MTPYLVDHSAFDAYALLVEAGGRRLLYSGDLRGHGRKAALFHRLVANPPQGVDALLLEGTKVSPVDLGPTLTEAEVEDACMSLFEQTQGMVLACYPAQNIDRVVSLHRAARRSGRTLVLDLYAAGIARATGARASIPQGDWNSAHVYVPLAQRIRVKQAAAFERTATVRRRRLFPEQLAARASKLVLTFRGSMTGELDRARCLDGAHAVWAMWPGYLDEPHGVRLRDWLSRRGIPLTLLHSSGHATVPDLQQLAAAVDAKCVVPVHTDHPEMFPGLFRNVSLRDNGVWWEA